MAYLQLIYLETPCECRQCKGFGQEEKCKYAGIGSDVRRLFGIYFTYVRKGNTPLLALPYQIAEVAELVTYYENKRDAARIVDTIERQKQREMLASVGIK